ncbi:hypothetical protein ACM1RC_16300 [Paenibacillus azoreducens]|uniref:hypothetical protein n=1 Tax=Paenibacillus azoreducens TaxID=116718 RepID=UPI0039F51336
MSKKLFMYRLLSNEVTNVENDEGIILSYKWNLIGLDRHIWKDEKIRNLSRQLNIRAFEVKQNNFDLLLTSAPLLDITIVKVEFSDDLSEEEHEELVYILRNKKFEALTEFIDTQRYEFEKDIEQITFRFNYISNFHNITFSRDGVLTVDLNDGELRNLISTEPIGLLSGLYLPDYHNRLH